jgi:hypothetical protein
LLGCRKLLGVDFLFLGVAIKWTGTFLSVDYGVS